MVSIMGVAFWRTYTVNAEREVQMQEIISTERRVTCPALLSIARTPRDTLIVMKNKPVCVEYVFDNMGS